MLTCDADALRRVVAAPGGRRPGALEAQAALRVNSSRSFLRRNTRAARITLPEISPERNAGVPDLVLTPGTSPQPVQQGGAWNALVPVLRLQANRLGTASAHATAPGCQRQGARPAVRILVRCQRPAWCASLQDAWQYARPTHGGRSLRADSHAHLPLSVRGPWVDCAPRMAMRSASLYGVPAPQCLCASRPLVPGASAPAAHWSLHLVIAYCNAASWLYVAHAQCKTACPAFIAPAALTRPEVMGTGGGPGRM